VSAVASVLLQGGVLDRAPTLDDGNRTLIIGGQQLDKAEVHQFDTTCWGDLDVARLDVPMEHRWVLSMQEVESAAELVSPSEHLALGERLPFPYGTGQQLVEVLTGHKVHHQVVAVLLSEIVGYLGKIGVIETCQSARFLVELVAALLQFVAGGVGIWESLLHGTEPTLKAEVFGTIGCTHASSPNQFDDLVSLSQDGSWR
jgi:hypothetical protein